MPAVPPRVPTRGAPHAVVIGASVSGLAAALGLQDKQSIEINKALQRGEDPYGFVKADGSIDEAKQRLAIFREGMAVAAREHLDVLRALFRHTNPLDLPQALFARQDLLNNVLACYEKHKDVQTKLRPMRDEVLALFAAEA